VSGDPGPLLWTVSLPINKVLETPSSTVGVQQVPNRVRRTTIDEARKAEQQAPGGSPRPALLWRHGKRGGCTWSAGAEFSVLSRMGKGLMNLCQLAEVEYRSAEWRREACA